MFQTPFHPSYHQSRVSEENYTWEPSPTTPSSVNKVSIISQNYPNFSDCREEWNLKSWIESRLHRIFIIFFSISFSHLNHKVMILNRRKYFYTCSSSCSVLTGKHSLMFGTTWSPLSTSITSVPDSPPVLINSTISPCVISVTKTPLTVTKTSPTWRPPRYAGELRPWI